MTSPPENSFWGEDTGIRAAPDSAPGIPAETKARPLTVTELTRDLKYFIETHFAAVFVEGEVSGVRPAASGHCYFVLKDNAATISCVLWASDAARLAKPLRDGDKVEIRGRISLYEQRGNYQIIVQSIRPAGLGKLFLQFQQLKEKLQAEGLFDSVRKRAIPKLPKRIGIVTSPTGAAIRDILNILSRRAPHIAVFIYPTRVQGEGAGAEIAHAIGRINALGIADVLIVGRGGGSIEDLWAFNEEIVAWAIFRSSIPVISAVGHEVDFTIADFVADYRAPTPSAAAEIVALNTADLIRELSHLHSRLDSALRQRFSFLRETSHLRARLENAVMPRVDLLRSAIRRFLSSYGLQRPRQRINEMRQRLDDIHVRLLHAAALPHQSASIRWKHLSAHLAALDPASILQRGYSITMDAKTSQIIRSPDQTSPGQQLKLILHKGRLDVNVAGAKAKVRKGKSPGDSTTPDLFGK